VARTSAELGAVLDAETADIVFVDSSGRPPTASTPEAALESRRKKGTVPVEVILCMAAATRAADAARVVATYAPVSPTSVCITKIDETASPSGIIHGPWAAKRPLSVLCHGPRVPEDVAPATFEEVQHRLASTPSAERST
jgi:flagellar biosynthesis protein FlhF